MRTTSLSGFIHVGNVHQGLHITVSAMFRESPNQKVRKERKEGSTKKKSREGGSRTKSPPLLLPHPRYDKVVGKYVGKAGGRIVRFPKTCDTGEEQTQPIPLGREHRLSTR